MLPKPSIDFDQEIANYERRNLEMISPEAIQLSDILDGLHFVRITGLGEFWKDGNYEEFVQICIDFVTSAFSYQDWFTFIISGSSNAVQVYIALDEVLTIKSLLKASFPGITFDSHPIYNLGSKIANRLQHGGMITGVPMVSTDDDKKQETHRHLERLVRGMRDATWIYVVQAYPGELNDVRRDRLSVLDKISENASVSKQQIQKSLQKGTHRSDQSVTEGLSGEIINRPAQYVLELLEAELERLDKARALGRWQVAVYYGANEEKHAKRLGSLLSGLFSTHESRSQPIRIHPFAAGNSTNPEEFHTYLTSEEVSSYIQLLREEYPGYAINDYVQFDVDYKTKLDQGVEIGNILWDGHETAVSYALRTKELTKHGVVFGVTGSGKTTTIFNLLDQIYTDERVPFLVIEPAKTEYRALLGKVKNKAGTGPIPELHIYTLGNDSVAPFRLNPFEFDISDDAESAPVLSHIDYLKVVFNAAFILYAPMPYILETALHEIYVDRGWNLATGTNTHLGHHGWRQKENYPIFPTLTDLYHKVETVTSRLGYEARIEQDVIAGLKARIGALRLGAKGLMLDIARGNSMTSLLSQPTVLELENIGNDDEKTFLIGLLLARIYGYRRMQALEGKNEDALQHILVIEEAHRLLKNTSTQVDAEGANLHAQAIETFVNILSEIRHYGQGVLVAEQIPSKLMPDVIKNTNLKVIHRLVAADDRETVSSTMNMDESQMDYLTTLEPGRAVVFSEGDDHPYLLHIDNYKASKSLKMPTDNELSKTSSNYINLGYSLSIPDFKKFGVKPDKFGRPDPTVYQAAMESLSLNSTSWRWSNIIGRSVYVRETLLKLLEDIRRDYVVNPGNLAPNQIQLVVQMTIVFGVARIILQRGSARGWHFSKREKLQENLTHGLLKLYKTKELSQAAVYLDRFARNYTNSLEREDGPYSGCKYCRAVCLYQEEVRNLLTKMDVHYIREALADPKFNKSDPVSYEQLARVLVGIVVQWMGEEFDEKIDIGYCTGITTLPMLGFDEFVQAKISKILATTIRSL
jgi:DNA helicase HerA-like ATPase